MGKSLLEKVWSAHSVRELPGGHTQLFIGLHLMHEVTSPQAFQQIAERGLKVMRPDLTFATLDHVIPTDCPLARPYADAQAEEMASALEANTSAHGVKLFGPKSGKQGVIHVIAPELGLIWPAMTVCCGDSHTCTHGAFGAIAFGIGTGQVADVLATQTVEMAKPKLRKVLIEGKLGKGVCAKDVALHVIRTLGVQGGVGFAYEFAGNVVQGMGMEDRMTLCNMSVEGGARMGYVNPDEKTFEYLRGREYAPGEKDFSAAMKYWKSFASDSDAVYDDEKSIFCSGLEPMVTWGNNPGQAIGVSENIPEPCSFGAGEGQKSASDALSYMCLEAGKTIAGTKIDVAFIGSCTNGRITDLREVAKVAKGRHVADGVRALVVPGSQQVQRQAEEEGLDKIFKEAGFEWRKPGCSMCLAHNPDKLIGNQVCASSSNRNFKGRQGSPKGRTLLMSPAMAAAAAVSGRVCDVRDYL